MDLVSRGMLALPRAHHLRRRDARHVCSIPFLMQRFLRFGPAVTRGMALDISMRGMSALVCGEPRVGETVVIELPRRGNAVELLATVRHSTNAQSGLEFFPLSPVAEQTLQDWIRELEEYKERLFPFMLPGAAKYGKD